MSRGDVAPTMSPAQLEAVFAKAARGLGSKTRELDQQLASRSRGNSRATTPSETVRPGQEITELRNMARELRGEVVTLEEQLEAEKEAHAQTVADLDIALATTTMLENDLAEAQQQLGEARDTVTYSTEEADLQIRTLEAEKARLEQQLEEYQGALRLSKTTLEDELLAAAQQHQAELLAAEKQHHAELEQQAWERSHMANEIQQLTADLQLAIQATDIAEEDASALRAELRRFARDGADTDAASESLSIELKESQDMVKRLKEATKVDKAELSAALNQVKALPRALSGPPGIWHKTEHIESTALSLSIHITNNATKSVANLNLFIQ